jgi:hypothetical protein
VIGFPDLAGAAMGLGVAGGLNFVVERDHR